MSGRVRLMVAFTFFICFICLFVFTGCSSRNADNIIEKVIGELIEAGNRANEQADEDPQGGEENGQQSNGTTKNGSSEEKDNNATVTVTDGEHTVTMSSEKIPDNYPDQICPIYQPSDILAVNAIDSPEMCLYTIMLLTKDDEQKVIDYYIGQGLNMIMDQVLEFASNDGKIHGGLFTGSAEAEYAAQGYKTIITITASVDK